VKVDPERQPDAGYDPAVFAKIGLPNRTVPECKKYGAFASVERTAGAIAERMSPLLHRFRLLNATLNTRNIGGKSMSRASPFFTGVRFARRSIS